MNIDGICTLGNDYVFDQIVALLNSIEAIYGQKMPVYIYPYDENTDKLAAEVASRPQVTLYNDAVSMERWDNFAKAVWDTHPTASQIWEKVGSKGYHRFGTHRRYCAFDGPFDRFIYMDADTILMSNLDSIFAQLENNDCIVYDFQYKDLTHVYDVKSNKLRDVFFRRKIEQRNIFFRILWFKKRLIPRREKKQINQLFREGRSRNTILYGTRSNPY